MFFFQLGVREMQTFVLFSCVTLFLTSELSPLTSGGLQPAPFPSLSFPFRCELGFPRSLPDLTTALDTEMGAGGTFDFLF